MLCKGVQLQCADTGPCSLCTLACWRLLHLSSCCASTEWLMLQLQGMRHTYVAFSGVLWYALHYNSPPCPMYRYLYALL
jgi:hypothetical protein